MFFEICIADHTELRTDLNRVLELYDMSEKTVFRVRETIMS